LAGAAAGVAGVSTVASAPVDAAPDVPVPPIVAVDLALALAAFAAAALAADIGVSAVVAPDAVPLTAASAATGLVVTCANAVPAINAAEVPMTAMRVVEVCFIKYFSELLRSVEC
jgi:hypothetical protein